MPAGKFGTYLGTVYVLENEFAWDRLRGQSLFGEAKTRTA
jgi:hypothetical protein